MACVAAVALAAIGCERGAAERGAAGEGTGGRLRVVCTVGMITDVVRRVGGERVEVAGLMGPGVDPHLYKPTRSDIAALLGADIVFYNGLLLEGKMTDALVRAGSSGRPVWAVTELIDPDELLEPEGFDGLYDPHVWMDPVAWASAVRVVRDRLAERDPEGRAAYESGAGALLEEVRALDEYARKVLGDVPESQRVLVTAHDAFNYFGRRYGFEVVGIQGISTESEAGVADVEALVELVVSRGVRAVFVESTVSERAVRALVDGAAARGHRVVIGGRLFSDAMGRDGTYEGTYVGMIDHNVTTIARALGGSAPPRGMRGLLNDGGSP